MSDSQQSISIGRGCAEFYIITHEIAHTLGLIHEMSRYDRDDWITVLFDRVGASWVGQYRKSSPDRTTNLNVPYDYGSVMHYSAYSGGTVEVLAKRKEYQHTMGNTYGPVFNDLLILNRYYQCSDRCTYGANCQNSGFRHPRNCNICVCPNGFGGADCSQRQSGENGAPPGCGQTVQAGYQYQTLTGRVTAGAKGPGDRMNAWRNAGCHFHIQAPPGKHVEIQMQSLNGICSPECAYGGAEVKFGDLTSVGAK
ncbi:metalloproteinase [Aphelenchoides avenae]|nr:metalloproteinase [Aphelenchus avenae]